MSKTTAEEMLKKLGGNIGEDKNKINQDKSTKHKPIVKKEEVVPGRKAFEDREKVRNKKVIVSLTQKEWDALDKFHKEHKFEHGGKSNIIRKALIQFCEFTEEEFPNFVIE